MSARLQRSVARCVAAAAAAAVVVHRECVNVCACVSATDFVFIPQ